jgi:hypothetical protein
MTLVGTPSSQSRLRVVSLRSDRAGSFDFNLAPRDCLVVTGSKQEVLALAISNEEEDGRTTPILRKSCRTIIPTARGCSARWRRRKVNTGAAYSICMSTSDRSLNTRMASKYSHAKSSQV